MQMRLRVSFGSGCPWHHPTQNQSFFAYGENNRRGLVCQYKYMVKNMVKRGIVGRTCRKCFACGHIYDNQEGATSGRLPELVGRGLVRSLGGWSEVLALKSRGEKQWSDQRILGDSEFVQDIISGLDGIVKKESEALESADRYGGFGTAGVQTGECRDVRAESALDLL
jgi:hypothetical protein